MTSHIKEIKAKLREEVRARLQQVNVTIENAYAVRGHFLNHYPDLDPKLVVAGTSAMNHELDPMPLMQALQERGHALCLPVTHARATPLEFRAYKIGDPLVPSVWGIGVPAATQPVISPDILLCPLLAFDRTGARLGYGGGYYDATLQLLRSHKTILAVGIAHAAQEVAHVPIGRFDQKLDAVVTEKELIVCNRQQP